MLFGAVCDTGGNFIPINGTGGCNNPEIKMTGSSTSGNLRTTSYTIKVTTIVMSGHLASLLSFTHPVTTSDVTILGNVR